MADSQQESSLFSTGTWIVILIVVAGLSFYVGYRVGQVEAGQIPCPPCKIAVNTIRGPSDGETKVCRLVGKIDREWSAGQVSILGSLAPPMGSPQTFVQDICIDHPVKCPEPGMTPELIFRMGSSNLAVANPVCVGPDCPKVVGCEP